MKNVHLCLFLMIGFSHVVHSSSQLRNSCSTNSCFKCRVSFFFPRCISMKVSEYSLFLSLVRQMLSQSLYASVLLRDSRSLVSRLIFIVYFSHISICESFCLDRSDCRRQRLGVGTVQSIVSTQWSSSTLAVSVHPHIHGVSYRGET